MNLKGVFQRIIRQHRDVDKVLKQTEDDHRTMAWHIYTNGTEETYHEYGQRFRGIHFKFKFRLAMPLVWLAERFLKKYYKGIPPGAHNDVLRAYSRAGHKTVDDVYSKFLRHVYNERGTPTEEQMLAASHKGTGKAMRTLVDCGTMYALNDVTGRESVALFMFNAWHEMNELYKRRPELQHLFYTGKDGVNVAYLYLHECMANKGMVIKSAGEKTCCELQAEAEKKI